MTEDDAKTKTCHRTFSRVVTIPETRTIELKPMACIGSACMAFRFETVPEHQQNSPIQKERPEGKGWERLGTFWTRQIPEQHIYYCGLAGKP